MHSNDQFLMLIAIIQRMLLVIMEFGRHNMTSEHTQLTH
jgi:hypothetical protein